MSGTDYGSPEIADLIAEAIASAMAGTHSALPGIVQSYDDATQTCSVAPAVRRPVPLEDGTFVTETMPIVQNVPVMVLGSPAFSVQFQLAKGDSVLLVYLDYSPAAWRRSGVVSDPHDTRQHGPAYPVAIPWMRPSGAAGPDDQNTAGASSGVRLKFTPTTVETGNGSDFVAMAAKVDARLTALETWAGVVTFPVVSLGSPTGPAVPTLVPGGGPTASVNLKAD